MTAPVPRQEGDLSPGQRSQDVVVRRVAERRGDVGFFLGFKPGHVVQPAAPDDSDFRFQFVLS